MRYFFTSLFILSNLVSAKAQVSEDFGKYLVSYYFEREKYIGSDNTKPKEIVIPFDSTVQKSHITQALDTYMDYIPPVVEYRFKQRRQKFEGWRIQIYRGKSREAAQRAKQKSYELFPNLTPYLEYSAPSYRVKVGDFLEPSEYQPVLKRFKRTFPLSLPVPDIITITVERDEENDKKDNKK